MLPFETFRNLQCPIWLGGKGEAEQSVQGKEAGPGLRYLKRWSRCMPNIYACHRQRGLVASLADGRRGDVVFDGWGWRSHRLSPGIQEKIMQHEGRGVIRLNDKADHGGHVAAALLGTVVMGIFAALEGDMTHCPKCKDGFSIRSDGAGARHEGRPYAYHDDVSAGGAQLISTVMGVR